MLASNFADFTGEEIQMLVEAGAVAVGLGQCRLRVETAAIAMLATVMLMSDNHQTYA
jgi:16S rRNA (uracil1498-N3)-methyltransferase